MCSYLYFFEKRFFLRFHYTLSPLTLTETGCHRKEHLVRLGTNNECAWCHSVQSLMASSETNPSISRQSVNPNEHTFFIQTYLPTWFQGTKNPSNATVPLTLDLIVFCVRWAIFISIILKR